MGMQILLNIMISILDLYPETELLDYDIALFYTYTHVYECIHVKVYVYVYIFFFRVTALIYIVSEYTVVIIILQILINTSFLLSF
jgi:hypothetical protein